MWKHFSQIVFLFFQALVCSAHYVYPGLGPIFAHQSQSVFQGSSSFGFGGLPPVSGVHVSAGGKPDASFSGSYGTTGTNGPFPSSSFQAFVQAGSSGGNGWSSVYPESPLPIGKPYPPPDGPISNDLKPSITNWETNYKVPCGTYRIHPAVVAHLRYNSGVPFEIAAMAKSGRHERSAETTTSPPSTSSSSSSSSSREGKHMDLTQYYNLAGTTCTWEFHANGNCELKFACPFFQLPAMYRCDENMIELSDAEHTAYKFCGNRKPRGSYTTSTNNLKLTFSSGPFSLPSVFHCTVTCMPKAETTTTPEPTTTSTTTKKPDPPPTQYGKCKCGVQRSYPTGRVIGGSRTAPGEFPWTVALVKQKSTRPFCGGALINNQYILSAAHCVQRSSMVCDQPNSKKYVADIEVLLNEHDITTVNTIPGGTVRAKVSAITIHPKFDNFTYNYDIAILKLDKAIDFGKGEPACVNGTAGRAITEDVEKLENQFQSQFVPICLPSKARAYTAFDDKQGVVTGWGFTKEDGVPSNSMMQAVVSIFNDSTCQDYFRATDVVTKQMLCAGHAEGKMDSCVGDSGGPLAVKEKEQYTLAGLVSWGRGCGRANLPGVYTRMNGLIEWIESETADAVWCQP